MTKFRDGFMMKSPLPAHGKLLKQLDILKNNPKKAAEMGLSSDRGDGKDYEAISKLKQRIKDEKAKHSSERTESDDAQAREDEDAARGSAVEMSAKTSPFQGYVDGEERVSHYQPTADLYQNVFDALQSGADKIAASRTPENMAKKKAMKAQRLEKRIDKRKKRGADPVKTAKLEKRRAEAVVDQTQFEDIANKNKDNQFDKLFSLMSKEDKEKYGLTTDKTT